MSEETNMINATLDNGRSLTRFYSVLVVLLLQAIGKGQQNVKFKLILNQCLFMLVPVSRMVNLASVELI